MPPLGKTVKTTRYVTGWAVGGSVEGVAGCRSTVWRLFATLILPLAASAGATDSVPDPVPDPAALCPETGDVVAIITRKRELWLCHDGTPAVRLKIALGQHGLDKRRRGDGKTPLGTYALGSPRPSERFGIFIPIDYPTSDQAAKGQTGGAVGIHGPPRGKSEPEYPTTAFDWTLGCVATGTDLDIAIVAEFVRERLPQVVIR